MPPRRPLAEWLRIKHGLSEQEANRRAFGLARYIQRHGTKPAPFVKPAFNKNESRLLAMLRQGAAEGVRAAIGVRGHYAMPLLWRDQVIGWANVNARSGVLTPEVGYVTAAPKDKAFAVALDDELHRMSVFLRLIEV